MFDLDKINTLFRVSSITNINRVKLNRTAELSFIQNYSQNVKKNQKSKNNSKQLINQFIKLIFK